MLSKLPTWLIIMFLMLQSVLVYAHPPGLSSMDLTIKANAIDVKVTFALQDIEAFVAMDFDLDAEVTDAERETAKPSIAKFLAEQLRITVDEKLCSPSGIGTVNYDDQNNAHVELNYQVDAKKTLLLQSKFLEQLPDGHQQYLTIKDANGKIIKQKMLLKNDDQMSLDISVMVDSPTTQQVSWVKTFTDFVKLGIEHILTGYDHLLFLFALLAVTHSFWPAFKIITFFTLAHSITLACAGLNIIELPSSFVEPVIAITIIYVALENVIRGDHPKGRQWLTFGFGLIHGFGFASVLREMGISSGETGILMPLLSFNLGIELGQLTVAIIVLPLIWWVNNNVKIADKLLRACSLSVAFMGLYWLLERTVFS